MYLLPSSNEVLVRLAFAGHRPAFEKLVFRLQKKAFAIAHSVGVAPDAAEDVVQEAFLQALRGISQLRTVESFDSWFLSIVRNLSRRQIGSRRLSTLNADESYVAPAELDKLETEELRKVVSQEVYRLPESVREVILLYYYEGESIREVGRALHLDSPAVKYRLMRGRNLLRERLWRMLSEHLQEMLPSAREWERKGRKIVLVVFSLHIGRSGQAAAIEQSTQVVGPNVAHSAGFYSAISTGVSGFLSLLLGKAGLILAAVVALGTGLIGLQLFRDGGGEETGAVGTPGVPTETTFSSLEQGQSGVGLARATRVRGVVLDSEGKPVEDAEVLLVSEDGVPSGRTRSDEAGSFGVEGPALGSFSVLAFRSQVGLARSEVGLARGDLILRLEPLGSVSGKVLARDSGAPLAGVTVQLHGVGSDPVLLGPYGQLAGLGGSPRKATTDAAGNYQLFDVPGGMFGFGFTMPDPLHVSPRDSRGRPPELALERGEVVSDLDFSVQLGGAVSGTVVDELGAAVPAARVRLTPLTHHDRLLETAADDNGFYRFQGLVPGDEVVAFAESPGLAPGRSGTALVVVGVETKRLDIRLTAGGKVSGRLVDAAGLGVEGVEISFLSGFQLGTKVSGASGAFEYGPLAAAGRYMIGCLSDGYRLVGDSSFTFPPSGDLTGLELRVEKLDDGYIAGRVVDRKGSPVEQVQITAHSTKGTERFGQASSDDRGEFVIKNLGGATELEVLARRDGYPEAVLNGVGINTDRLTIELGAFGRVSGRVVGGGGEPLQSFELRIASIHPTEGGQRMLHGAWQRIESSEGRWYLDKVPPARTVIEVREEEHVSGASEPFEVSSLELVEGIEIRLQRSVALTGLATHGATRPAAGIRVRAFTRDTFYGWLLDPTRDELMTMAGADGRFKLMGLTPGQSYNLVAWREGLGTRIIRGVQAGESTELMLVDEGRLEVRLGGSGGAGDRLVRIEHQGVPDGELAYSMDLRTDALGFVEFRGLPQGGYRVFVRDDDVKASLGLVESIVGAGETSRVSVDLDDLRRKHGSVRGLVSDHEQVGAVSLRLVSRDNPRDVYGTVRTASDGRFHFTGVPPGAYVVVGQRSKASHDELAKQVTVEAGATTEIELALEHK